jgi:poly(3-hydroxybutyrate) depolymerase
MSSKNQIDPVSFLSTSTVYIFSGLRDELMIPQIVEGTYNFYKAFVPLNQITFVEEIPINHAWPTKNSGNPCWYYGQFFVNSCGYDGAGIILTTLLGPLYQDGQSNSSNLFSFPQTKYVNVNQAALDVNGWIYVPTSCQKNPGNCRLHVNIHGCGQEFQRDGLNYINNIGMNIWAEGNNIVIIYPQTVMTAANQGGCWDIDGYTGPNFALKSGIQIQAIHGMAQDYVNIVRSLFM